MLLWIRLKDTIGHIYQLAGTLEMCRIHTILSLESGALRGYPKPVCTQIKKLSNQNLLNVILMLIQSHI